MDQLLLIEVGTIISCSVTGILWRLVFVKEVKVFWLNSDSNSELWACLFVHWIYFLTYPGWSFNLRVRIVVPAPESFACFKLCSASSHFCCFGGRMVMEQRVEAADGRQGFCHQRAQLTARYCCDLELAGRNQNATLWLRKELKICLQ